MCIHTLDGCFPLLESSALAREQQPADKCSVFAQIKGDFRAVDSDCLAHVNCHTARRVSIGSGLSVTLVDIYCA